jgi:hypothetical protein
MGDGGEEDEEEEVEEVGGWVGGWMVTASGKPASPPARHD